jgi:hypothetical protein
VNIVVSWTWPADFPDDCPPEGASATDGTYYRIVKSDPPETSDFVSVYDQNRARAEKEVGRSRRTLCETMGLSVFADIDDALQCASRYRNLGKDIASVTLTPDSGKILETPGQFSSHHTWWKAEEFDPMRDAQVVRSL